MTKLRILSNGEVLAEYDTQTIDIHVAPAAIAEPLPDPARSADSNQGADRWLYEGHSIRMEFGKGAAGATGKTDPVVWHPGMLARHYGVI